MTVKVTRAATASATKAKPLRISRSGLFAWSPWPCHQEPADHPSAARVSGMPTSVGEPWWMRANVNGR